MGKARGSKKRSAPGRSAARLADSGLGGESVREIGSVNGIELVELTAKLNGIILRKAELQGNFEGVYLDVFERMATFEALGEFGELGESGINGNNVLEILGDVGG